MEGDCSFVASVPVSASDRLSFVLPDTLIPVAPGKELSARERDGFASPTGMARLMARGHWQPLQRCTEDPLEAWLADCLGYASTHSSTPPPWAMLGLPDAPAHRVWWVSPVHVGIGREGVTLTPPESLDLSDEEAAAFNGMMLSVLAPAGWTIRADAPTQAPQWGVRMQCQQALPQTLSSPWSVARQRLTDLLPSGAAMADWRRLWMELQVTLHTHPLNAARQARGLPAVNAYWWWGGGGPWLPDAGRHVRFLVSDLAQAPQFADSATGQGVLGGQSRHRCAAWLGALLDGSQTNVSHTVHLVESCNAAIWTQAGVQHPAVQMLDQACIAPLAQAAASHELVFLGQSAWRSVRSSAGLRLKFWKNTPSVDALLEPVDGLLDEADLARAWQASAEQAAAQATGEFPH